MLTPEREAEIRYDPSSQADDLLAEIDRLRGENENLALNLDDSAIREHALRAEVERLRGDAEKLAGALRKLRMFYSTTTAYSTAWEAADKALRQHEEREVVEYPDHTQGNLAANLAGDGR